MKKAVCPYNGKVNNEGQITFCDSTLREGELNPGAAFTYEEKLRLVKELDNIGVSQFVVTSVGVNNQPGPDVLNYIKEVQKLNLKMGMVFSITGKSSVDFVEQFNPSMIRIVAFTSKYLNRGVPFTKESFQNNVNEAVEMVKYISSKGLKASVGLCDSTRAVDSDLFYLIEEVAKAGAFEVSVVDTAGVATPEAMEYLVSNAVRISKPYGTRIGVHCHNDFGLSLANIIAAVKAGATSIDTCMNGLGDRCGNASLTEVASTLELLYDKPTGINLSKLKSLSDLTADLSGIPLSGSSPLVGDYAFSHQQNVHIVEFQHEPLAWQGIEAETVGNQTIVIFGKQSGPVSIDFECKKKGRSINKELYPAILKKLSDVTDENKNHVIMSDEFWTIVDDIEKE